MTGLAAALAVSRMLRGLTHETSVVDPITFGIALVIAGAALLGCYLPAHRALRTDPLIALRQ